MTEASVIKDRPVPFAPQTGEIDDFDIGLALYVILGVATGMKLALYFYCEVLSKRSSTALALAEDHWNDVLSNAMAILTAAIASNFV
jgi:hypothetical protein